MCGIISAVSKSGFVVDILISGLQKLEYRGYDSAGVAVVDNDIFDIVKSVGKIAQLRKKFDEVGKDASVGIAHTRWATHGAPNEVNAHPHVVGDVAIVHNGIIENYQEIKDSLADVEFVSETDSEVIAALINHFLAQNHSELDSFKMAIKRLKGAFAIVVVFRGRKDLIIATKKISPLCVGLGDQINFVASDPIALSDVTNQIIYLEDGDICVVTCDKVELLDLHGNNVTRSIRLVDNQEVAVTKNGHQHFMLKEILEQPQILSKTLAQYYNQESKLFTLPKLDYTNFSRITIIACGSSYYAGMVAKYWFESYAKIACDVEIASEFRYRDAVLDKNGLCIFISQSGETADTLAALLKAKSMGQKVLSIVNAASSSIARESDLVLECFAGAEIGVASTKAFTCSLAVLAMLALDVAKIKGNLKTDQLQKLTAELYLLPGKIADFNESRADMKQFAADIAQSGNFLYIGRNYCYPIALEGALKLRELSYINAQAIASGELKHGTIALVDEDLFIVSVIPCDDFFSKNLSTLQEVSARKGKIICITSEKCLPKVQNLSFKTIIIPITDSFVTPILSAIPMQLLAYYVALARGNDIDQPRNLAKSVTVE